MYGQTPETEAAIAAAPAPTGVAGPQVLEEVARQTLSLLQASHAKLDLLTRTGDASPEQELPGLTDVLNTAAAVAVSLDERIADIVGRIGRL